MCINLAAYSEYRIALDHKLKGHRYMYAKQSLTLILAFRRTDLAIIYRVFAVIFLC